MQRRTSRTSLSNEVSFIKNIILLLSSFKHKLIFVSVHMGFGVGITIISPLVNRAIIDRGIIALDFSVLLSMLGLSALLFLARRMLDFFEFIPFVKMNKILGLLPFKKGKLLCLH
jgi:ABC-type multidrug transport system fused ATPase/permease subunit